MLSNTKTNMGLFFDDDAVHLPRAVFDGLTDFTIEWWVRFERPGNGRDAVQVILGMPGTINGGPSLDNLFVVFQDPVSLRLTIHFLFTNTLHFGPPLLTGIWYHIAIVRAGNALQVFLNGDIAGVENVSDASFTLWDIGAWLGQDVDCPTGCFDPGQSLRGALDEVRVWNIARSEAEIRSMMTNYVPCGTPGLVADWRLDEPTGQVARDASGNGFDAWLGESSGVADPLDPQRVLSDAPIPAPPSDCNNNAIPDDCDIADRTSLDCNSDGIPDECQGLVSSSVEAETSTKNRFLSFSAGDPGANQAIRVTFDALPAPFDIWNGAQLWVGPPSAVSENAASVPPAPGSLTFNAARLQCDPYYTDWTTFGTLHVFHERIVPGGSYSIQVINASCNATVEAGFSPPLTMDTPIWGDTVLDLSFDPPLPPNGSVDVVDALAILKRFSNAPGAISKPRADLEPGCLDLMINVSDVLSSLSAFSGVPYSFTPTAPDPCGSTCANPLP